MGWRARLRARQQGGMTLVETLLAMSLAVLVMIPILGWAQFAFQEQASTRRRNIDASGLGLMRTYLLRDIASADTAWVSGANFTDCTGGDGSGGTLLVVLIKGTQRLTYTRADGAEAGTSLWRRTCSTTNDATVESVEVVTDLVPAGASVDCVRTGDVTGSCLRINLRIITTEAEQASITATVRSSAATSAAGGGGGISYESPTVVLGATPVTGNRGMTVDFSSAGSADPGGGALTYFWEFGDGATSTQADPSHTYTGLGPFTAVLTVTNAAGTPATDFVVIDVLNRPPTAVIAAPEDGLTRYRGQSISFSSAGSNDSGDGAYGGAVASYAWDFGDGTTSTQANPTKTYNTLSPTSGFTVKLTVTDNEGETGQAQIKVKVVNRTPSVTITASPSSGATPLSVSFTSTVVDETSMTTNPAITYAWDFGDGGSSSAANPTHTYNGSGSRTATLTITDDAGATAGASRTITLNSPPTAAFTASPGTGRAPFTATFSNTSSDSDGTIASSAWNFGDGGTSTAQSPTHQFTHNVGSGDTFISATYTVTLTVTDSSGATGSTTRTVTATGAPAPSGFSGSGSGCQGFLCLGSRYIDFTWGSVSATNMYQIDIDPDSGLCSAKSQTFTGTSGRISGLCIIGTTWDARIRSRDANTGKWGAWSSTIRVGT